MVLAHALKFSFIVLGKWGYAIGDNVGEEVHFHLGGRLTTLNEWFLQSRKDSSSH